MLFSTYKGQDKFSIIFLIFGVPIFFPLIFLGKIPGPFASGISDTYVFFEPYALAFTRAIINAGNPFWSHESSFGAPTLLTLGTGALHPFHIFHIFLPDWLAFVIGWWARIAIFSVYFYAYLRNRHCRPWIAFSSTIALSFGSLFLNYSLEIIGYVMAFFPMALYYVDKLCIELKTSYFILLVLSISFMIMGGFPSVILYLLLTLGAYIIVMAKSRKNFVFVTLACFVSVLMVLPVIVETLSFYPNTGYDPEQRKWLFFYDPPFITALNLVIPSVFGDQNAYRAAGMRDFYGSLLGAGILTVPFIMIFSIYSFRNKIKFKKEVIFWCTVLLFCLFAYFNLFQIKQILKYLPVLNEHPFTRLQTLIVLASATTMSLMLEQMMQLSLSKRHCQGIFTVLAVVLFCLFFYAGFTSKTSQTLINCIGFGVIAFISTIALARAITSPKRVSKIVFIICTIGLGVATSTIYTHYFYPKDYYPENELTTYVKVNLESGAKVLDVQNVLYKNTAIAYGTPSITNHWFSPPPLRKWVYSLSSETSKKGLTIDVIKTIDKETSWSTLRQMHVQFVSLPYEPNKKLVDVKETANYRVIRQNYEGISLLEVLDKGQTLKEQGGLSGDGYTKYLEKEGQIRFFPESKELITIPVRFNDGWFIKKGAVEISSNSKQLIVVRPNNNLEEIELYYFPKNFLLWLLVGPIILLFSIFLLEYLVRKKPYIHL